MGNQRITALLAVWVPPHQIHQYNQEECLCPTMQEMIICPSEVHFEKVIQDSEVTT